MSVRKLVTELVRRREERAGEKIFTRKLPRTTRGTGAHCWGKEIQKLRNQGSRLKPDRRMVRPGRSRQTQTRRHAPKRNSKFRTVPLCDFGPGFVCVKNKVWEQRFVFCVNSAVRFYVNSADCLSLCVSGPWLCFCVLGPWLCFCVNSGVVRLCEQRLSTLLRWVCGGSLLFSLSLPSPSLSSGQAEADGLLHCRSRRRQSG